MADQTQAGSKFGTADCLKEDVKQAETRVKQEPLDAQWSGTSTNLYDALLDVVKHEVGGDSASSMLESPEAEVSLPVETSNPDNLASAIETNNENSLPIYVVAGDAFRKTPGGSLRPALVRPTVSSFFNELEDTDFDDDELQDTMEREPWILQRWLGKFPSSTGPLSPTDTAEAPFANVPGASGIAVAHAPAPTSAANVVKDAAAAKVMPSTSGMVETRTTRPKDGNGSDMDSDFDDEYDEPSACITALPNMDRDIPDDDQLDESAINIVHAVDNAMDDALKISLLTVKT